MTEQLAPPDLTETATVRLSNTEDSVGAHIDAKAGFERTARIDRRIRDLDSRVCMSLLRGCRKEQVALADLGTLDALNERAQNLTTLDQARAQTGETKIRVVSSASQYANRAS